MAKDQKEAKIDYEKEEKQLQESLESLIMAKKELLNGYRDDKRSLIELKENYERERDEMNEAYRQDRLDLINQYKPLFVEFKEELGKLEEKINTEKEKYDKELAELDFKTNMIKDVEKVDKTLREKMYVEKIEQLKDTLLERRFDEFVKSYAEKNYNGFVLDEERLIALKNELNERG